MLDCQFSYLLPREGPPTLNSRGGEGGQDMILSNFPKNKKLPLNQEMFGPVERPLDPPVVSVLSQNKHDQFLLSIGAL